MSLQDRLAAQDASQLLLAGSSIALVAATSPSGTRYNFPLMLFGIIAHEMHSSTLPMRQFLNLVLISAIFDVIHFFSYHFSFFMGLINLLVLLLKAPIFFTCLAQLRERGGDLRFGPPNFQGLGNTQKLLDWSMPGSFGTGPASQPSAGGNNATPAPPPGSFPSSGGFRLGGDEDEAEQGTEQGGNGGGGGPPPGPAPGRNGYQSIA